MTKRILITGGAGFLGAAFFVAAGGGAEASWGRLDRLVA